MTSGAIVTIVICVAFLIGAFFLRKRASLRQGLKASVAVPVIVLGVLVAAVIDYMLVFRAPTPALAGGSGQEMMPGSGGGGMPGGMGGGGGMGGMGANEPNPRRDLSRLVRKMAQFQKQAPAAFSADQAQAVVALLVPLESAETMTAEEAEAKMAALRGALSDAQKTAIDAIELPRPSRGGPGGPGGPGGSGGPPPTGPGAPPAATAVTEGTGAAPAGAPPGVAAGGPPGGDRMAAMRERLLQMPYVKKAYETKLAEDPELATSDEKRRAFFRDISQQLSPFQQASGKEALQGLLTALRQPTSAPAAPAGAVEATAK